MDHHPAGRARCRQPTFRPRYQRCCAQALDPIAPPAAHRQAARTGAVRQRRKHEALASQVRMGCLVHARTMNSSVSRLPAATPPDRDLAFGLRRPGDLSRRTAPSADVDRYASPTPASIVPAPRTTMDMCGRSTSSSCAQRASRASLPTRRDTNSQSSLRSGDRAGSSEPEPSRQYASSVSFRARRTS
jgi:hypothetical protein